MSLSQAAIRWGSHGLLLLEGLLSPGHQNTSTARTTSWTLGFLLSLRVFPRVPTWLLSQPLRSQASRSCCRGCSQIPNWSGATSSRALASTLWHSESTYHRTVSIAAAWWWSCKRLARTVSNLHSKPGKVLCTSQQVIFKANFSSAEPPLMVSSRLTSQIWHPPPLSYHRRPTQLQVLCLQQSAVW